MERKDGSLGRKDYLIILVLVGGVTLAASMLIEQYFHTKMQLLAQFRQEKTLVARYAAANLTDFLVDEQTMLTDAAGMYALLGDVEKGRRALDVILKSHRPPRKPYTFFVMDKEGRFQYSVPESLVDRYMQDLSDKDYFSEAAKSGKFYYSGAQPDGKGGWEVVLSTPIMSASGKGGVRLLGVLAERIDLTALDRMFISNIQVGPDGYAFLVDENGRLLANKKSNRLYQIEGSSETLGRMLRGEEGSVLVNSPETKAELTAFSPVLFGGRAWSVGIVSPSSEVNEEAARGLRLTLLIMTFMALAFSWSIMSVVRTRRERASLIERAQATDHLMLRNRELTVLNDLSDAMSGGEDLDGTLRKALEIILADTGARGGSVRLVSQPSGELVLKTWNGVPVPFVEKESSCALSMKSFSNKAMVDGRPGYLSSEALKAAYPECHDKALMGLAVIPLMVMNKPLGVLHLWGLNEAEHSEERLKFLFAIGNQMAARVENVMQMEDTKRHSARATALFNTAQALTRSLDLDALLNIIMNETATLLKAKRCLLLLYNEEANRIDCRVSIGFDASLAGTLSFNPSGVFWDAMEDGAVKVVDLNGKRQNLPRRFIEVIDLDAFILVPLVSKGKVLGFIVIETTEGAGGMLEDLKLIVGFANQAAVAIETSSFYIRTVEKYNEDLQQLSNRIIEAQEEERKRISRDLHDELGQSLTAIKINLDMALDSLPPGLGQIRSRLGDAVSLVLATLDSVRRLSFELRPSMLDDLGLSTVLGKLISDFRKRSGIDVEFSEEGPSERLDPHMEVVLYRVVQEALTNIAKHAKATRVVVNLKKDPAKDVIGLYIEDNGVGLSLKPNGYTRDPKGFGLMGIKERVSLLGGNFRISAEENKGTKLLIDIPWTKGEVETWKEM